jgi:hypothetical protein
MPHLGKKKGECMTPRNVIMKRIKWFTFNIIAYQLLNKFKEGIGGMGKKEATICSHPSPIITKLTYAGV